MKILLTTLNAKYVHANLALKYLYMAVRPGRHHVTIREFTVNNSRDYVFTELVGGNYDVVCFSCYIWNIRQTLELAESLKKARPQVKLVVGGPEVSYDCGEFMEAHPFLDFLIAGEGERAFGLLLENWGDYVKYCQIEGMVYRGGNPLLFNPVGRPPDFGEIPFPYSVFPCEEDKVIYYESSRGCPFSCSYCVSSIDEGMRALPVERVKRELDYFLGKGVKQVKFLDRTFNWDRDRSLEIFQYLIEKDTGDTNFHFELCGDLLDRSVLAALNQARKGLFQFEIGIQSTNAKTLAAIDRAGDVNKALEMTGELVRLGNSHVHVDLIAGLPLETYAAFAKSFDQVYALGAENLQLGFLKLLKGTKIRETAKLYGYQYMSQAPYEVISNDFMTAGELCKLKGVETVLELYHNRGGFESSVAAMLAKTTPFAFYESLAAFYYAGGFQHKSHRKEDLYRILDQFARDNGVRRLLESDLERAMNFDAVKKFKQKGWGM